MKKQLYRIHYVAGPYSGFRNVWAEDSDEAIILVRAKIRREMTLPMYSDSYRVIEAEE